MSEKERKKSHFPSEEEFRKEKIKAVPEYWQAISDLSAIEKVYESISILITQNGRMFSIMQNGELCILRTELIDSSIMTLKNIRVCIENGNFADAYTLLRKLRDDTVIYLYFLVIIKTNGPNVHEYNKHVSILFKWFDNKIEFMKKVDDMLKYIKKYHEIADVIGNYKLDDEWEKLKFKLNDFVHTKGHKSVFSNFSTNLDFQKELSCFAKDAKYIAVFFMLLILLVDSTIVSATDYVDHLQMNALPPEGSQYEVAPVIQEFITNYLREHNNELVDFIRKSSVMNIK